MQPFRFVDFNLSLRQNLYASVRYPKPVVPWTSGS